MVTYLIALLRLQSKHKMEQTNIYNKYGINNILLFIP